MLRKILQKLSNMKFRYKIMIVYICIGFLPLLIVFFFMFMKLSDYAFNTEIATTESILEQAMASVNSHVKVYNNLSDYLSFNEDVAKVITKGSDHDFDKQLTLTLDPLIHSVTCVHTDIEQITIYSREDIVSHGALMPISTIKNESWYQEAIANDSPIWFIDQKHKTAFSARKMPLVDRSGVTGILYIKVNYDELFEPFENIKLNYSGLHVAQNEKLLYERHTDSDDMRVSLSFEQCLRNNAPDTYGIMKKEMDEGWQVYYYYLNPGMTDARIKQDITFALLGLLLFVILALIILLSTSQMLVGRIEKLQENVKAVENGSLEFFVTSEDQDEIGELIRGFGLMINRIKFLIEEVYEANLNQRNYEMRALQQQINPHFLYNTLSMINFMAIEVGHEDISNITLALSDFYRTSLNKGRNTCSLADELKNMNAYLDIQMMMHDYEFDVDIQIDETMKHYESLNLILQPIVENAIEHGLDLLEDRKGVIKIYVTTSEHEVYVMIEDNGVGMSEEDIKHMLEENSKGYGMRNVNERIKLYYGEAYGLHIESAIGEGTIVTVKLPKKIFIPVIDDVKDPAIM